MQLVFLERTDGTAGGLGDERRKTVEFLNSRTAVSQIKPVCTDIMLRKLTPQVFSRNGLVYVEANEAFSLLYLFIIESCTNKTSLRARCNAVNQQTNKTNK